MTGRLVVLVFCVAMAGLTLDAARATALDSGASRTIATAPTLPEALGAGVPAIDATARVHAEVCPEAPAQLVDALGRRARALDEREASIHAREQALVAAQEKLDTRLAELETLRVTIGAQLDQADAERAARVARLVTMVESNRPSAIAPMFATLELDLAVEVLDRMNRQKAGKLLAAVPPARASELATRMASPVTVPVTVAP